MFNLSGLLQGLIPVRTALSMLTSRIEETVGHDVDHYKMLLNTKESFINFKVFWPSRLGNPPEKYNNDKKLHNYRLDDGETLSKVVKDLVKSQFKLDVELDFIVLDWNDETKKVSVDIFYTDNKTGEKIKKTKEL